MVWSVSGRAARSRRLPGGFLSTPILSELNQDKLKTAILTTVDYLNVVYRQQNDSGQFAHEEWGRANRPRESQTGLRSIGTTLPREGSPPDRHATS
jgi:hypothetical protein